MWIRKVTRIANVGSKDLDFLLYILSKITASLLFCSRFCAGLGVGERFRAKPGGRPRE